MSAITNYGGLVGARFSGDSNAPAVGKKWAWSWGDWIKSLVLSVLSAFSSSASKELSELKACYETDLPPEVAKEKAKAKKIRLQVLGARREILNETWLINGKPIVCIDAIIEGIDIEKDEALERLVNDNFVWPAEDLIDRGDLYKLVGPIIRLSNGVPNWQEINREAKGESGLIPTCRWRLKMKWVQKDEGPNLDLLLYDRTPKKARWFRFHWAHTDPRPNGQPTRANFYKAAHDETMIFGVDALRRKIQEENS